MTLVLHCAPMSSSMTTHWVLEELGVPYDKVKLDLAAGDTRKPAHLAINPNGKVPVIVHDDVPIVDAHVASWTAYIAMMGHDLKNHPNVEAWNARCTSRPAFKTAMMP